MKTLQERLRQEAALIQYGERACVPGLLHEAATELDKRDAQIATLMAEVMHYTGGTGRDSAGFLGQP